VQVVTVDEYIDWDTFFSENWGQNIVHVRNGVNLPFAISDVFSAAVSASDAYLRRPFQRSDRPGVTFTVANQERCAEAQDLPRLDDSTLDRYIERMASRMHSVRYALVINALHSYAYTLWSKERLFLDQIWRNVGIPASSVITTLFHGNYRSTPVGVHLDRFATFMFAVRGRKRMRFWSQRPWKDNATSKVAYTPYLASSLSVIV